MEHWDEIGFQIHTLHHEIRRMIDREAFSDGEENPTGTHGWVIGYLYERRNEDVFQRDIQARFSIQRSTVTGILQLMEKKGLITRRSVEEDARLKKIELTPRAIEIHERVGESIRKVEKQISQGLTPQEREAFLQLCDKIRNNLK